MISSEKPTTLVGVHILFRRFNEEIGENEYLLHKRVNTKFLDGHYSVPGGHIETSKYETPAECVIREAEEELGIKIKKKDLQFIHFIYRNKRDTDEVRPDFSFLVKKWSGKIKNLEDKKHSELKWYPTSKLPKPMVRYVANVIKDVEKGIVYRESDI